MSLHFVLPPGWIVRDRQEIADAAEGRLLNGHEDEWNEVFRSLTDAHLPLVTVSAPPWDDPVARIGPHEIMPAAVVQLEQVIENGAAAAFDLAGHVATELASRRSCCDCSRSSAARMKAHGARRPRCATTSARSSPPSCRSTTRASCRTRA